MDAAYLAFSTTCAVGLKKTPRRRRAICPKLRRQISVCFWLPAANLIEGDLSPVTRKETRPWHGQLRHLSKCASVLKSMATCQPMATCRQNSNCYFELLGLSNALAAGTQSRLSWDRADGLSLRQSLGLPHVAKQRWHRPQRDDMTGSPGSLVLRSAD